MSGQFIQFDHITLPFFVIVQKIGQRQLFGNDIKLQIILSRHRLTASTVNGGTDTDNGGKRFAAFTSRTIRPDGRMKHRRQITHGTVRTGITAIITTQYVRRQRTDVFATATLGRFILAGVIVEQRIVCRRHNSLNRISGGGFTGTVTTGQQIDRTKFKFSGRDIAPVNVNKLL